MKIKGLNQIKENVKIPRWKLNSQLNEHKMLMQIMSYAN